MILCLGGKLDQTLIADQGSRFMCIDPETKIRYSYDKCVMKFFDRTVVFYYTDIWNSREVVIRVQEYIKKGLL